MELSLNHNWEQAVIAAAIEAAVSAPNGLTPGRTAIQKMAYFLGVLGVPLTYKFRIHYYGPFCSEVASDLDWLLADEIIEDRSQDPRRSEFALAANWSELKQQYQSDLDKYAQQVQSVGQMLGPMDPRTQELVATLDFSFRWVHAQGGEGPWKERTIKKFKEIKQERFSDPEIERFHETLVSSKLISG